MQDGIAGAAVDAGRERVAKPSVGGVVDFPPTVVAEAEVGGEQELGTACFLAFNYLKINELDETNFLHRVPQNPCPYWTFSNKFLVKKMSETMFCVEKNMHSINPVAHRSGDAERLRQSIDERAKSYALDLAFNMEVKSVHFAV